METEWTTKKYGYIKQKIRTSHTVRVKTHTEKQNFQLKEHNESNKKNQNEREN